MGNQVKERHAFVSLKYYKIDAVKTEYFKFTFTNYATQYYNLYFKRKTFTPVSMLPL